MYIIIYTPFELRSGGLIRSYHFLISNPLYVFEQNLLPAAIIKLCGPAVGMAGDSLGGFKGKGRFRLFL